MQLAKAGVVALLVMSVALAGCFGGPQTETKAPPPPPPELDKTQQQRLEQLAAPEIRDYKLPGSQALPKVVKTFLGQIGPEANAAVQDRNMRGGNNYGVQIYPQDISDLVPVGQPTALRITLSYFGSLGSSAQAHIYVCVPGECSYYVTNNNDEFNWKVTVETKNVMTVGVSGVPAVVGVAAASGKIVSPLDFNLTVEAQYFANVVTPFQAYAFKVPQGATGVTLRSVKPGQEHLQAKFIVIDPNDQLVTYTEYDDIAVTSESIFIPARTPGEYVFYAQQMHNGFFSLTSDAPLGNDTDLRVLTTTETQTADVSGSPAPGMIERDPLEAGVATPFQPGTETNFNVDQGFPLEVRAYIGGDPAVTGAVEVRILSANGEVYRLQRVARVDTASGSLGYTRDETNTLATWANLAPGSYTVQVVADGETGEIGH
ncbi:MAG TPA: hypothetical protein VGR28_09990, partial [Candidatus Thermoplasmatota archaeon]|nr:hypothetical protein [Candidatus Thermoplasmatota archaeon]